MAPVLTPRRVWIARSLAVAVDLAQVLFLPTELTPFNNGLDLAAAIAMVSLVGWHWAFLPTFLAELVPFVDLVPTWTLAVLIATRGRAAPVPPTVVVEPRREEPGEPAAALPPKAQERGEDSGS